MPIPNGGLITETNAQYYAGSQRFLSDDTHDTKGVGGIHTRIRRLFHASVDQAHRPSRWFGVTAHFLL